MKDPLDLMPLDEIKDAAECLKVMGHPMRLRIVDILLQGDFSVGEIADLCGLPPHQTCEHLRLLQNHGLLSGERRGRTVYYKIIHPRLPRLLRCVRESCQITHS